MRYTVDNFARSNAIVVVGEGHINATFNRACELSAGPCECVSASIIVGQRITYRIICNCGAVIAR